LLLAVLLGLFVHQGHSNDDYRYKTLYFRVRCAHVRAPVHQIGFGKPPAARLNRMPTY
jgi:hypothetical protein